MEENFKWEDKYSLSHGEKYPWDSVVTFVYRYYPRDMDRKNIKVLEVGCGAGNNILFFAKEGFQSYGIDISKSAIDKANVFLQENNCNAELRIGSFTDLPFDQDTFDLVVDRGALCCVGTTELIKAIDEISRVMKKGGKLLTTPYVDSHTSCYTGIIDDNDMCEITQGSLLDVGRLRFLSRLDIDRFYKKDFWEFIYVKRL